MFILSFDIAEMYKYRLEMYNSALDLNFFDNTIKPILNCYGIIQYLNLLFFSCDHSGLSRFFMALCNFF